MAADSAEAILPSMVSSLRRLGAQLEIHGVRDSTWLEVLRTIFHMDALSRYSLVAVTGSQGAGKTTLVANLYAEAAGAGWLVPNLGRGERMPVVVVEVAGLEQPRGVVVRRRPKSDEVTSEVLGPEGLDEWQKVVRGQDAHVLMARLEVPPRLWHQSDMGFALLPGFERADTPWQDLLRIVLVTSPAAVIVTDDARMADGMQAPIVNDLRTASGAGAVPIRALVAVSRCDGIETAELENLIERAATVYGVQREWVVPVGATDKDPRGWIERFRGAVEEVRPAASVARRLEVALLRATVRDGIGEAIAQATKALDQDALDSRKSTLIESVLARFDEEREHLLLDLDRELKGRYSKHLEEAARAVDSHLPDAFDEFWNRFGDWITIRPDKAQERLMDAVNTAWDTTRVSTILRETLAAVVASRRSVVNAGQLPPPASLAALARMHELEPTGDDLLPAVRMLPTMALEARAFAIRFARVSDGQIDASRAAEGLKPGSPDFDQSEIYLAGIAALVGAQAVADPMVVSSVIGSLVTGLGPATAVGVAALTQALFATPALAGGVLLLGAMNRERRDRSRKARSHLSALRVATEEHIRTSVEDVLRLTREVLAARLRLAVGMDDDTARQLALQQVIRDARRARDRMLVALGSELA